MQRLATAFRAAAERVTRGLRFFWRRRRRNARLADHRFRDLVEMAADAIILVDEDQRIVLYNRGAERIFGWTSAEAVGQPLNLLVPEKLRDAHTAHIRDFAAVGNYSLRMAETRRGILGRRKNGETFPAEASISTMKVGRRMQFTAVLRDMSDRKRVEDEQRFLSEVGVVLSSTLEPRQTLESIGRLAVRDLADWCIVELRDETGSSRWRTVLHRDPSRSADCRALEQVPLDPLRPHFASEVLQTRSPVLKSEVGDDYLRSVSQSDEHLRLLRALAPASFLAVPLVTTREFLGSLILVSTRRRYSDRDLRLAGELGTRAALAIENSRMYEAARRATQLRDDVLRVVAHDLRNPLGAALLAAGGLAATLPAEERLRGSRVAAEVIERSLGRVNRIIQDLLDVTRIETGGLAVDRHRVPATQVLIEVVEAHRSLASSASREIRLELVEALPDVWADRDRLLQVFENLLSNAVKFTSPGGHVVVGAIARETEVEFRVADDGIGIPVQDRPHLFDRFWQAHKGDRRGIGLGLTICKAIVEAHGGVIRVESGPTGSTFFFTVPRAAALGETAHP